MSVTINLYEENNYNVGDHVILSGSVHELSKIFSCIFDNLYFCGSIIYLFMILIVELSQNLTKYVLLWNP